VLLELREGRTRLLFDCGGETREVWVDFSPVTPEGEEIYGLGVDPTKEGKAL
jgi:hypothetical protein